ncbi:hypothetical protein QVD99_005361 [Batrachochytrium dendrobatidis]|nr:hypothetical protein QVD99_005361 [Batrachochytrium dendrobatidis]
MDSYVDSINKLYINCQTHEMMNVSLLDSLCYRFIGCLAFCNRHENNCCIPEMVELERKHIRVLLKTVKPISGFKLVDRTMDGYAKSGVMARLHAACDERCGLNN